MSRGVRAGGAMRTTRGWWPWAVAGSVVAVVAVTVQQGVVRHENNFAIFRTSFYNLIAGRDLYAAYPALHTDLFKYSPTFALLFAPFALPPFAVGLLLWNALNTLLLVYAIGRVLPPDRAAAVVALCALEIIGSMQRSQSNGLVTALIILSFVAYEARAQGGAAIAVAAGACIKIFPLAALSGAVMHPRRARFAVRFAAILAVFVALPLVATSAHRLAAQYRAWGAVEAADASALRLGGAGGGGGLYGGVMQQVRIWFGVDWPDWPMQLVGTLLLLLPLARRRERWADPAFRLTYLCSVLVFSVIFNHQSESPSFVIAVTGIMVWCASGRGTRAAPAIALLTVVLVSLPSTDVTPRWLYDILVHYRVKTLPCVIAWAAIQADLLGTPQLPASETAEVNERDSLVVQQFADAGGA